MSGRYDAGDGDCKAARPPLCTIVTPVLDGARYLPELLASIATQDYRDIEHIVVDGGSTDGTLEILRAHPAVRWTSGHDRGMYDALNRGFREARGEIVAYQNADDRYAPGAIRTAVEEMCRHPEVDVLYGHYRFIDPRGRPSLKRTPTGRSFDLSAMRRYNFVPAHSSFVRRRVLFERGIWLDPELRYAGDWDWFLRMALDGRRFAFLDTELSDFRLHSGSLTTRTRKLEMFREWRRICRRAGSSLLLALWYKNFYMPMRRRLGLAT